MVEEDSFVFINENRDWDKAWNLTYNSETDSLLYLWKDCKVDIYPLTSELTIYKAQGTKEMVGAEVYGVREKIEEAENWKPDSESQKYENLEDFLKNLEEQRASENYKWPGPAGFYNQTGDSIQFVYLDKPHTGIWISHSLSVFLDETDRVDLAGSLSGVTFYGVKGALMNT